MIRLKNTPIESTIAAFWKVVIMPAPEPRALPGRLFITSARLGAENMPMPDAVDQQDRRERPSS